MSTTLNCLPHYVRSTYVKEKILSTANDYESEEIAVKQLLWHLLNSLVPACLLIIVGNGKVSQ